MAKKIGMIVTAMALPGEKGYPRYNFLANLIQSAGYEVDVILSTFQHWEKQQRKIENLNKKEMKYNPIFIKEPGYRKNIDIKRIISHKIFSKNIRKYLEQNKEKYDLLYCIIPDNFVAKEVTLFAKKYKIPLIIDVEDLWPEAMKMVIDIPLISDILFYPFTRAAEIVYENCNGVIGSSDEYRDRPFKNKKRDILKETVYVGNELRVYDKGKELYFHKINKTEEEYWVSYAGTIGTSYDIKTLVLAGNVLKEKGYENIKIKILGTGPLLEEVKELAKKNSNIEFLGYVEYQKMAAYLSKSDVVVNSFVKKAPQSIVTKIGDYLASGKPMINTCNSVEFKNKVEKDNFGINIEAENIEVLVKAILKLYNDKELACILGKNARRIAEEEFDREKSYYKIVEMIGNLL